MTKFKIDTEKARVSAKSIQNLADRYYKNIDSMFDGLKSLPTNNIWIGTEGNSSVYTFLERVMKEKEQYGNASKYISSLGNYIEKLSNSLDNASADKIK